MGYIFIPWMHRFIRPGVCIPAASQISSSHCRRLQAQEQVQPQALQTEVKILQYPSHTCGFQQRTSFYLCSQLKETEVQFLHQQRNQCVNFRCKDQFQGSASSGLAQCPGREVLPVSFCICSYCQSHHPLLYNAPAKLRSLPCTS